MKKDSLNHICCPKCRSDLFLTANETNYTDVVEGVLDCALCNGTYEIKNGMANLFYTANGTSDPSCRQFYDSRPNYDYRPTAFRLGIWDLAFNWEFNKRQWSRRLELQQGQMVLETGAGNGNNLPYLANAVGTSGRLDGMDISSASLEVARKRMTPSPVRTEFIQANACHLPYKGETFDAVLHIGGFNEFDEKKNAIDEMHRVAKTGAKIVFMDEGLAPGREKTLLGKYILRCNKLFKNSPPLKYIPATAQELKVYWIYQGTFWVIDYRKGRI